MDSTGTASAATGGTPEQGAIPEAAPPAAGGTPQPQAGTDDQGLKNALKAERDARKKAEDELKALRDAQRDGTSSTEQLAKRVQELERDKADAERKAMVLRLLGEHSLPSAWADRVRGSDETELKEDIEHLKTLLPTAPAPQTTVGGPQGPPATSKSPEEWVNILRARR